MTPLSPAAATCLRQIRDLTRELDMLRGTHDQQARTRIVQAIRECCDRYLKLMTH